MPVCSARPAETPPSMRSVPLRRSGDRPACGCSAGGRAADEGAENGAVVMTRSLSRADLHTIGKHPDPTLVLALTCWG